MAHATTRLRTCLLVRHAIADVRGPAWPDDEARPLTADGIARMTRAVQGLAAVGVELDQVLSSPLVRARQTADILLRGVGRRTGGRLSAGAVTVVPALAPGHLPEAVMRAVADATDATSIALVGHEPDLGLLAGWLLGIDRPVPFKKGAVCCFDVRHWPARSGADLRWFATPKMLRRMAGR